MSEISDKNMIHFYNKYLNEEDIDIELDGRVSLNNKMGLVSTVEDARQSLEKIFKLIKISLIILEPLQRLLYIVFKGIVKSYKLCYTINILSQVYGKEEI